MKSHSLGKNSLFFKTQGLVKDSGLIGTSLVVQWVRLHAPNAGGPGSIPGQGTRSHMHAATKKSTHRN